MSSGAESAPEEQKTTVPLDKPILKALLQNPTGKDVITSPETNKSRISLNTLDSCNDPIPKLAILPTSDQKTSTSQISSDMFPPRESSNEQPLLKALLKEPIDRPKWQISDSFNFDEKKKDTPKKLETNFDPNKIRNDLAELEAAADMLLMEDIGILTVCFISNIFD